MHTPTVASGELGKAAQGAALTFVGALVSALLGFGFNILLARLLGPGGSGVVLQTMGVFTIAMTLALMGLDTTAIWLLPRLLVSSPREVRGAFVGLAVPAFVSAALVAAVWFAARPLLGDAPDHRAVFDAIGVAAWFLPAATLMTVAIATTRALGGVLPFTLIDRTLVPGLRLPVLAVAVALGGGTSAAALAWSAPWFVGMVAALAVAAWQVGRLDGGDPGLSRPSRPDRAMSGVIARYAAPRALAAVLDQAVIWLDVILVGIIAGPVAAGVYGSASRFVSAGVVVSTALRIVVAPRFSALLAARATVDLQELYTVTAGWILLFGSPIYLTLAVYAPTVLAWLGPGFGAGASSLLVLSLGSLVVLAAGNIQSLLLMSGRSGLGAMNKAVVVAFNVAGNLLLVPAIGILGAALTWAASMALDTALAAYQVRRSTGIVLSGGLVLRVAVAVLACVAVPLVVMRLVLGEGSVQLVAAVVTTGTILLGYVSADRRALRLHELRPGRR